MTPTSRKDQLLKMLDKEPDDAFLRFALAMELAKAGETAQALEQFDRVLQIDSTYLAAWMQKAAHLEQSEQFPAAKKTYRDGIAAATAAGDRHAADKMREALGRLERITGQ